MGANVGVFDEDHCKVHTLLWLHNPVSHVLFANSSSRSITELSIHTVSCLTAI